MFGLPTLGRQDWNKVDWEKIVEKRKVEENFPPNTTKNQRNELRKLNATYLNNTAIGLTVAGGLVPIFVVIPKILDDIRSARSAKDLLHQTSPDITTVVLVGLLAVIYARVLRGRAQKQLITYED